MIDFNLINLIKEDMKSMIILAFTMEFRVQSFMSYNHHASQFLIKLAFKILMNLPVTNQIERAMIQPF